MHKHVKNLIYFSLIISFINLLMSCAPQQGEVPSSENLTDDQIALHVLVDFLDNLHHGKYDEAAQLYGGMYEIMIDHNPGLNPQDHSALLRNACSINGAQCLQVKSAGLDKKASDIEFIFKVDFLNTDGTLFVLGPCCGGNETDFPPESVFYLRS